MSSEHGASRSDGGEPWASTSTDCTIPGPNLQSRRGPVATPSSHIRHGESDLNPPIPGLNSLITSGALKKSSNDEKHDRKSNDTTTPKTTVSLRPWSRAKTQENESVGHNEHNEHIGQHCNPYDRHNYHGVKSTTTATITTLMSRSIAHTN